MEDRSIIEFMKVLEKLKCNTRHSWTSTGRHESVAEHSWRLAVLSLLVRDRFPGIDMDKVLLMCLIHDWGEAVTGDVPSFEKKAEHEEREYHAICQLLSVLPEKLKNELGDLFQQMQEMKTPEAKLWRALDMMEAVFQHNEADVSTWIELERTLNLVYGNEEIYKFDELSSLRDMLREDSLKKLEEDK